VYPVVEEYVPARLDKVGYALALLKQKNEAAPTIITIKATATIPTLNIFFGTKFSLLISCHLIYPRYNELLKRFLIKQIARWITSVVFYPGSSRPIS